MSRTDKEARLKDFISEALAARCKDSAREICVTLFVRNADSPVARMVHAAWSENPINGARLLLLIGDTNSDDPAAASVLDVPDAECRVLADPSFGPAHEQLTIGHTHVWIGDCLRRDPTKRDAFELYHPDSPETVVFAIASFKKLWEHGRPLKLPRASGVAPEIIAAQADDPNGLPRRDPRH